MNVGLEKLNHKENKLKQDSQSEVTLLDPNKVTKKIQIDQLVSAAVTGENKTSRTSSHTQ